MVLTKKLATMFPIKLHYILSQNNGVIGWTQDGTAIRVLDKDVLVKDYLPTYFNRTFLFFGSTIFLMKLFFVEKSFASFRHQLNAYGFSKVSKGENVNCYFHPYFCRDQPGLIFQMGRHAPRSRRVMQNGKLMLVPLESSDGSDGATVTSSDSNSTPTEGAEGIVTDILHAALSGSVSSVDSSEDQHQFSIIQSVTVHSANSSEL